MGVSFGLLTLFTDLTVAGVVPQDDLHVVTPLPGPLMPWQAGVFFAEIAGTMIGLLASYRQTTARSLRYQIRLLLLPTGLVILASLFHVGRLFAGLSHIPHEPGDALLIIAALLYAKVIIQYGTLIGHPLSGRRIFYVALTAIAGLFALQVSLALDNWLMQFTDFPFPPATSVLVLVMAAVLPAIGQWMKQQLDRWLFKVKNQQQQQIVQLAETLAEIPDPLQLQYDLLETICTTLGISKGYIASSSAQLPANTLQIKAVHGNLPLKPGNRIPRPPHDGLGRADQFFIPLGTDPAYSKIDPEEKVLFCPVTIGPDIRAVLVLGEKHDGTPFTAEEIALCQKLTHQLRIVSQMNALLEQRDLNIETVRTQNARLKQLGEKVIASSFQTFTSWQRGERALLEIRVLGALQVARNGTVIAESDWGSERAKSLLAYLLWKSPAGATRAEISSVLWPDRSEDETANVFHVTLHRLRRVLQPKTDDEKINYVEHGRGRYRFNTNAPYWLDVTAFKELAAQEDLVAWQMAVDLYRGSYLEDISWALPVEVEVQRRQLEQLYCDILRKLATRLDGPEGVIYLEKLLIIEPTDEIANRDLILRHLARGRRDLAQKVTQQWQQTLAEHNLEPSPETLTVWEMV
ncbi:MAG: BTAD domain-containing putative transcriptional regulator [Anaerolineae bacterium]|nr:BTAD domain-containing putative transcriptional regulator [Anaerolineae bacterium]